MLALLLTAAIYGGYSPQPLIGYADALPLIVEVRPIGGHDLHGAPLYLRTDAAIAWLDLVQAARQAGFTLHVNFAFRTMEQQIALKRSSRKYANPPGLSTHQEGLAVDLKGCVARKKRHRTKLDRWMVTNAPKYGWVQTSRKEPWHWTYTEQQ